MTTVLAGGQTRQVGGFRVRPGQPLPLGARAVPGGVTFAVFSASAERLSLVLYDRSTGSFLAELPFPDGFRAGNVHAMTVLGLSAEAVDYGYRVGDGAGAPVLLDPYGTAVAGGETWGERPRYRSRIAVSDFDWAGDRLPRIPTEDLVIYELHVRGFTRDRSSGVRSPGTFEGLREKIPYLRHLGVNCVELLPIFEFDETDNTFTHPGTGRPLLNYWGYNPLAFFGVKAAYAARTDDPGTEFKLLVRDLHRAGIEVILDVVFNHTGEGGSPGRTVSFRGLDEATYYLLSPDGEPLNLTATGNTVNANHPVVRALIVDSLRHWALEYHVDGFRFDMAPILNRGTDGRALDPSPLVESITHDPVLADRELIAEPWDATGLDQAGRFAAYGRWMEWNGRYRDAVRRFLTGADGATGELATCLVGSPDLFPRGTAGTVNYVTSHDGFTLADWAAYQRRHNAANGEGGSDGVEHNHSANHGVEGPTGDPEVLALRRRQVRNALALLLVSSGVPMLLAGDESGRTQRGNNNAYAQDNEVSWVDWDLAASAGDLTEFVRRCVAFRRAHPVLRHQPLVSWHGTEPDEPDWESHLLVMMLRLPGDTVLVAANAGTSPELVHLPDPPDGTAWDLFVDTASAQPRLADHDRVPVGPRSVVILTARPPA